MPKETKPSTSDDQTTQQGFSFYPENKRRILPLYGVSNFRDLGGYPTQDNRHVKWGLLYRSGHLARSSKSDQEKIIDLGITRVIDFRSERERSREPDRLPPEQDIQVISIPIQENKQAPLTDEIRNLIEARGLNGLDPTQKMEEMYVNLASTYTREYRMFFRSLLEADGKPLLWHCSAGKDRAGFAAALLLKILGVQEETILEDYLLSQGNVQRRWRQLITVGIFRGIQAARFIHRMNEVDRDWLLTSFRTINEQWGSFDAYVAEALHISPRERDQLKATYLD